MQDPIRKITSEQFVSLIKAQRLPSDKVTFKCPMCGTLQNGADLVAAGAGPDFEAVKTYVGFSCVGRFTGAPSPRKAPDGSPCNWTLGGLFRLHKLEVFDGEESHPYFEPATPEEALAHVASTPSVTATVTA